MNVTTPPIDYAQHLQAALANGQITGDAATKGERLLNRVKSPVRISVLGLPGSGKSSVLNMLVGRPIVPEGFAMPTLEVSWGPVEQTKLTLQDGSVKSMQGLAYEDIKSLQPAMVRFELPAPFLENIDLLEPASGVTDQDQLAATKWAARRGDAIMWCSQAFAEKERKLWAAVPDQLKDHSFFILTKADKLSTLGQLEGRISVLKNIVSEEFHSMVPLATLQAIEAVRPDGSVDEVKQNASGARRLIRAIRRQVDRGRSADMDSVLMFLNRYAPAALGKAVPAPAKATASTPQHATAAPGIAPSQSDLSAADIAFLRGSLTQIRSVHFDGQDTGIDPDQVLETCQMAADGLADYFTSTPDPAEGLADLTDDVLDVSEMVTLMQLEGGAGSAADAATLMLQLRRGIERKLAA